MFGMTSTRSSDDNHGTILGDVVIVKQTEKKCSLAVAGLILSFFIYCVLKFILVSIMTKRYHGSASDLLRVVMLLWSVFTVPFKKL